MADKNPLWYFILTCLIFLLTACGMGMMGNPVGRIPSEYANQVNQVASDNDSITRGEVIFQGICATCHGESGQGDGPASVDLDPSPANIASIEHLRSEAYLFYRISEGGAFSPFNSAMPAFKEIYDENQRWDVINYIRTLGNMGMMPDGMMGR